MYLKAVGNFHKTEAEIDASGLPRVTLKRDNRDLDVGISAVNRM